MVIEYDGIFSALVELCTVGVAFTAVSRRSLQPLEGSSHEYCERPFARYEETLKNACVIFHTFCKTHTINLSISFFCCDIMSQTLSS